MAPRSYLLVIAALTAYGMSCYAAGPNEPGDGVLRVATYNVSMYREQAGQLRDELETGESRQAEQIAEVLQRVRPHLVLLNEFDYEPGEPRAINAFREKYLERSQAGLAPLAFPHFFYRPVNTGVDSGMDLDRDGELHGPADAWGYGRYPGQYGMLLLSRVPLGSGSQTYQKMEWRRLGEPRWPTDPVTGEQFYSEEQRGRLRLASKSFWDVEVRLPTSDGRSLRILCAHPTPPGFDGPEDCNGCRNYDEIRMVAKYITGDQGSQFPVDDNGLISEGDGYSTLPQDAEFVVLGDLNADPVDGSGQPGAIQQLLDHPRIDSMFVPTSEGGVAAAQTAEDQPPRKGDPAHHTANFSQDGYHNLRVDYVLPSKGLKVLDGGVFWPKRGEPGSEAIRASDHRLVWIDIDLGATAK